MELKTKIKNIKNINECKFVLPIEKGIYCLVGTNGCGKSTVMSCVAQSVFSSSLQNLSEFSYDSSSRIEFEYGERKNTWVNINNSWNSLIVDELVKKKTISVNDIVAADDYVKKQNEFYLAWRFKSL